MRPVTVLTVIYTRKSYNGTSGKAARCQAERLATASPAVAAAVETADEAQKPARRALPQEEGNNPQIYSSCANEPTQGDG
jgi:hypothetical protein